MERKALIPQGRADLAERGLHISMPEGDGAGYDIKSYTPNGKIKYIAIVAITFFPSLSFQ